MCVALERAHEAQLLCVAVIKITKDKQLIARRYCET